MYTFSLFSGNIFRDSDDLNITNMPEEFAEYQLWATTNTPTYITYHISEKSAFAEHEIPILINIMREELHPTNTDVLGAYFEQFGYIDSILEKRNEIYERYKATIHSLDENYEFGDASNHAKVDLVYRFTATENSDHIIVPPIFGRNIIHKVIVEGTAIYEPTYNESTGRLDVFVETGNRIEVIR